MAIQLHLLKLRLKEARLRYPAVEHSMGFRAGLLAHALAKGRVLLPEQG